MVGQPLVGELANHWPELMYVAVSAVAAARREREGEKLRSESSYLAIQTHIHTKPAGSGGQFVNEVGGCCRGSVVAVAVCSELVAGWLCVCVCARVDGWLIGVRQGL